MFIGSALVCGWTLPLKNETVKPLNHRSAPSERGNRHHGGKTENNEQCGAHESPACAPFRQAESQASSRGPESFTSENQRADPTGEPSPLLSFGQLHQP